uniref:Jasmonate O-methyltransferase n=1 Tax=Oryza punctata TaxID=4537 RepID=A0A0E0L9V4_ORYPU
METKSVLDKVNREVYTGFLPHNMVIVDLGCSLGPNTLRFVSEVINIIISLHWLSHTIKKRFSCTYPYLNLNYRQIVTDHLINNAISFTWVPEELNGRKKSYLNKENICITKTTTVGGGTIPRAVLQGLLPLPHMVLTFCGRKNEDARSGELNHVFGLVAESLQSLVAEGLVEKESLESFNLPMYTPSVEVGEIVKNVNLFEMDRIDLFECDWDHYDDSQGYIEQDSALSSMNVAKCVRAAVQPLIACYFGEGILNALFNEYANRVAKHLEKEKAKFAFIVVS